MMEKPSDNISTIQRNLDVISSNILKACADSGRRPQEITLLGVTKTVLPEHINAAIELGIKHIGENRVQEYLSKKSKLNLKGVDVHLIGHLQTNKVSKIITEVNMIETLDSFKLADAIDKASVKAGCVTDVLVEVNIGREHQKSGVLEEDLEEFLYRTSDLGGICVKGLMTVPPILNSERQKREVFSRMYKLFIDIRGKNIDNTYMDVLSMGMSSDYKEAIMEGATIVRIGSALFGERQ